MASVLHGSARTTPRIRAELQASKESGRSLAARYDLNPKTVRKWRRRTTTADAPMGPKARKSTVLTPTEEAIVVAFRQKTLLPLDDVLAFVTAYNFAKHLKALTWRTPYQAICNAWTNDSAAFKINPRHLIPGPHT